LLRGGRLPADTLRDQAHLESELVVDGPGTNERRKRQGKEAAVHVSTESRAPLA
jgi:hypothetical protein